MSSAASAAAQNVASAGRGLAVAQATSRTAALLATVPGGALIAPQIAPAVGSLIGSLWDAAQQAAQNILSGATVQSEQAVGQARAVPAPTSQDLAAAAAPQLSQTMDPVGITDPAIPATEFVVPAPQTNMLAVNSDVETVMDQVASYLNNIDMEDLDDQITICLGEMEEALAASKRLVFWNSVGFPGNLTLTPNRAWVGQLVPA